MLSPSTYRFCMWHIMKKLSEKVGVSLNANDEFNNNFKSCVWSSETQNEFKEKWNSIMVKYELQENRWLKDMYVLRNMWIPAYFKDIFLGGILRTTSISESENSFYCTFLNFKIGLVEFWMRLESAIEAQRHREILADNDSLLSHPVLKLDRGLEKNGRYVYTREFFYIFQELWIGCVDCGVDNKEEIDGMEKLHIVDNSTLNSKLHEVAYNTIDHSANCSCKMFQSQGIPCRHILCVLKREGIHEIPSYFVVNRWTKSATSKSIFNVGDNVLEGCSKPNPIIDE